MTKIKLTAPRIINGGPASGGNKIFASLFGIGYLKPVPGTLASLVIFILGYFYYQYFSLASALIILIILIIISYFSIKQLTGPPSKNRRVKGDHSINQIVKYSNVSDPSWIVIDEVLGSILILIFIPYSITSFIVAFLIFRLFDGQKIWPINLLDKIKTPLGVIIDDLGAGIIVILITNLMF